MKVFVENFYEVMNRFKVNEIVIIHVDTDTEVETGIAPIDDFEVAKLQKKKEKPRLEQ